MLGNLASDKCCPEMGGASGDDHLQGDPEHVASLVCR